MLGRFKGLVGSHIIKKRDEQLRKTAKLSATWLPSPPNWTLTYTPDTSKPPVANYWKNQWVLQNRTPEPIVPGLVWFVRETAVYYYSLASS